MMLAKLVSLLQGQSYSSVQLLSHAELKKKGYPLIFEDWTTGFYSENKLIYCHILNICVIQIDEIKFKSGTSLYADRLVLDGDVIYEKVNIMSQDTWDGIIPLFLTGENLASQFVFSCDDGIFITHDSNVVSVVIDNPVPTGVLSAKHVKNSFMAAKRLNIRKDCVGKIESK